MVTKIQKWGNSLAVRLPKEVARKMHLHRGVRVSIEANSKIISIRPVKNEAPSLEELVLGIKPKHLHKETNWGRPSGKEIW